jgi:hypothetical protein
MKLSITLEGEMGLTWPRWQWLVTAVEQWGFAGLYRSDHFVNPYPPDGCISNWILLAKSPAVSSWGEFSHSSGIRVALSRKAEATPKTR